ncbi:MAG TPA: pyridoxal-phosphate dependent enzyme [Opitutales bacterium]|nr:pyridoxal-phosphate dependent enzyme [Opitutales bacterium]
MNTEELLRRLRQEILFARRRVYEIGEPTPLQKIETEDGLSIFVKREDLSPINAYKWRGAYNCIAQLDAAAKSRGVITASAGNHAQGVALAAHHLGLKAVIYMPMSTPRMKLVAVKRYGGKHVEICLHGDTYDAASSEAHKVAGEKKLSYIHAYDDLAVMAGQGTLADEIIMSGKGPFDVAFLQVGGGGMAAAAAVWLKMHYPDIHIIGVEGEGQASMAAAIRAGEPVTLDKVDVFCDGTAVRKVGALTHRVCGDAIDEWMTVSNDEVSAAIQFHWEQLRCVPEPSGAMGMAAALKRKDELKDRRVLTILCGANMDFEQIASVARRAAVGGRHRRYLRIRIPETNGAMFALLSSLPDAVNIADFQYGKIDSDNAAPVIGFDLEPSEFDGLKKALTDGNYETSEVTSDTDVDFRMIHYDPKLFSYPIFITLEFHERPGALGDFLREVSPHANLCYFNYVYSGERVGRALLGFEFDSQREHDEFTEHLDRADAYRSYELVGPNALERML